MFHVKHFGTIGSPNPCKASYIGRHCGKYDRAENWSFKRAATFREPDGSTRNGRLYKNGGNAPILPMRNWPNDSKRSVLLKSKQAYRTSLRGRQCPPHFFWRV